MRSFLGRILDLLTFLEIPKSSLEISRYTILRNALQDGCSKVAIVVLFERAKEIDFQFFAALEQLRKHEYEIVLVSNCLPANSVLNEIPQNFSHLTRPNNGRDFAAYKAGVYWNRQQIAIDSLTRLILLNDSVSWTPEGVDEVMKRSEGSDLEVLGLTISRQRHQHVQSYFYLVKDNAIPKFTTKLLELKNLRWKRSIVHLGERKLSKDLVQSSLRIGALFTENELMLLRHGAGELKSLKKSNTRPVNTILEYQQELSNLSKGIKKVN